MHTQKSAVFEKLPRNKSHIGPPLLNLFAIFMGMLLERDTIKKHLIF